MQLSFQSIIVPYRGFSVATWKSLTAGFINATGLTLIAYLTLYLTSLNYSVNEVGLCMTLFGAGGLLGGYLGGYLVDKLSALKVCKFSLILNSLLLFLLPLTHNFYLLAGLLSLIGFAGNLFRPAFILMLTQEKNKNVDQLIALRRVIINLGMAFGAAIFGLLISTFGYSALFFTNGAACLIAYTVLIGISEQKKHEKTMARNVDEPKNMPIKMFFILILMFIISVIFNQNQITYPLYLEKEFHISIHYISYLFALNGISIVLLQMPISNFISKQKNSYMACAIGALFISAGLAILPFCRTNVLVVLSCLLWTMGEIIFFPAILSLILSVTAGKKGKLMGWYQFFFSLASFAAPSIGTFGYAYGKNFFWYINGLVGFSIGLSFLLFSTKHTTLKNTLTQEGI